MEEAFLKEKSAKRRYSFSLIRNIPAFQGMFRDGSGWIYPEAGGIKGGSLLGD
jgi:hypothetical protein